MAEYDFIKMQKKLAKYLDEDRYEHTLGVMFTCAALAMVHDCDLITAQTAGLLHDCAKCIPNKKKLKMCSQHHIFQHTASVFDKGRHRRIPQYQNDHRCSVVRVLLTAHDRSIHL